ncbi:hypothetical protein BDV59DRAFT_197788 [Aspergillus ambiguus]|uniref:uncharacterized protein n=1 Tax=Aspergillus ambiguus TaxID=176160 RepID=UPI003CCD96EA
MKLTILTTILCSTGVLAAAVSQEPAVNASTTSWKWCKANIWCHSDDDCVGMDCGQKYACHCGTFWWPRSCWTYNVSAHSTMVGNVEPLTIGSMYENGSEVDH